MELNRYALTALREAKSISKADLARAIEVDRTLITRFENGERPASEKQIQALAKALGVSVLALTGVLAVDAAA